MAEPKKDFKKDAKPKPRGSASPIPFLIGLVIIATALSNTRLGKYLLGTTGTSTSEVATSTSQSLN